MESQMHSKDPEDNKCIEVSFRLLSSSQDCAVATEHFTTLSLCPLRRCQWGGPRLHRLFPWFDPESAAVVTILLGLFQVLMSALLVYTDTTLPKIFILPLLLGILIMAGGSLTMANERNPSRSLLQQCASSNVAGLVGALLAFCLYCYSLSVLPKATCPLPPTPSSYHYYRSTYFGCPLELMEAYTWSIIMLLLLYNSGAIFLHGFLSLSAIKTLKAT